MADVESHTVSEIHHSTADRDDLVSRLDELLEQYLHTLDAYQKAQQQLTKHLSSGYLSLAKANFANNAHTRYGQDYYDERMQASRKIAIVEDDGKTTLSVESPVAVELTLKTEESTSSENDSGNPKDASPSEEAEKDEDKSSSNPTEEKADTSKPAKRETPANDPLRWFGVLVPPALRAAQTSFVSAVEGPVVELSTLLKDLRQQEIEIGRVRKQIKKL